MTINDDLVEQLRATNAFYPLKAADALEAVLAERDALKAELVDYKDAAASEADFVNEQAEKIRELKAERDALAARLAPVEDDSRHLTAEEQKVFHSALRRSAKIKKPVEDEALVEIAAYYFTDGSSWSALSERLRNICRRDARNVIAAIRPHIEAAERERCAKVAEGNYERLEPASQESAHYKNGRLAAAAAIRSGSVK